MTRGRFFTTPSESPHRPCCHHHPDMGHSQDVFDRFWLLLLLLASSSHLWLNVPTLGLSVRAKFTTLKFRFVCLSGRMGKRGLVTNFVGSKDKAARFPTTVTQRIVRCFRMFLWSDAGQCSLVISGGITNLSNLILGYLWEVYESKCKHQIFQSWWRWSDMVSRNISHRTGRAPCIWPFILVALQCSCVVHRMLPRLKLYEITIKSIEQNEDFHSETLTFTHNITLVHADASSSYGISQLRSVWIHFWPTLVILYSFWLHHVCINSF